MAKFCAKCGAPLKENVKFCAKCGAPVPADSVYVQSVHTSQAVSTTPKEEIKNNTVKYLACAVGAIVIIGGGFWGYTTYQSKNLPPVQAEATSTKSAEPENTTTLNNTETKEDGSTGQLTDVAQDKLDKAREEITQMVLSGKRVTATSYGHSDKGFMAMVGGSAMIFDRQNHRYATIWNIGCLNKFRDLGYSKQMYPVLAQFVVWNDTHDQDENAGYWEGNRHFIPINMNFKYEGGQLVDNGLFTANGRGASSYRTYLFEQKNVDLAHLFMEEAIPFIEDAHDRGLWQ